MATIKIAESAVPGLVWPSCSIVTGTEPAVPISVRRDGMIRRKRIPLPLDPDSVERLAAFERASVPALVVAVGTLCFSAVVLYVSVVQWFAHWTGDANPRPSIWSPAPNLLGLVLVGLDLFLMYRLLARRPPWVPTLLSGTWTVSSVSPEAAGRLVALNPPGTVTVLDQ